MPAEVGLGRMSTGEWWQWVLPFAVGAGLLLLAVELWKSSRQRRRREREMFNTSSEGFDRDAQ